MNKQLALMSLALLRAGVTDVAEHQIVLHSWASSRDLDVIDRYNDEMAVCISYARSVIAGAVAESYNHSESVSEAATRIGAGIGANAGLRGEKSNMPDIDHKINGWQRGLFYVVGGLKKTGKSRFVLNLASPWLLRGMSGIIFSLEMSPQKIHECVFANRQRVDTAVMGTGRITQEEYGKICEEANRYSNEKLYISKKSGISPDEMKAIIAVVKQKYPVDFVIVDYIQRMKCRAENRVKEIERCALDLADMARDENVIMIALSQLSGEAERQTGDKAIYSYFKESQAILESADVGIVLFDKNRGKLVDGFGDVRNTKELMIQIIQRDGESDISFPLTAQLQYSLFGCPDYKRGGNNDYLQ